MGLTGPNSVQFPAASSFQISQKSPISPRSVLFRFSLRQNYRMSGDSSHHRTPRMPSTPNLRRDYCYDDGDDDDFQTPSFQTPKALTLTSNASSTRKPLKPSGNPRRRPLPKKHVLSGKENSVPASSAQIQMPGSDKQESELDENCSLDLIESSIDCSFKFVEGAQLGEDVHKKEGARVNGGYFLNSVEARLMRPGTDSSRDELRESNGLEDFEGGSELDVLIRLCSDDREMREQDEISGSHGGCCLVQCPVCGIDISDLDEESRLVHTNHCLDKEEIHAQDAALESREVDPQNFLPEVVNGVQRVVDASPVLKWLENLGLERYAEVFVREEIDWDTLKWLTEEDLMHIGVAALGPRKKIVQALSELRKGPNPAVETHRNIRAFSEVGAWSIHGAEMQVEASVVTGDETSKSTANKLITDYFPSSKKKICNTSPEQRVKEKCHQHSICKSVTKNPVKNRKIKDIPLWCNIPGTSFRVDAFKYLRGDCFHWFLTHFHMDHYQGLTRSFCHGKIYCSLITARLVNMKIGLPWDKLQVLPLNQKINIAGVDVTCLDANHCPGSIIILFEPPNGKAILHTGDFRFCEKMVSTTVLQTCPIHTLILDTTYCNPQYDFPKQEAVIQFVIEAIQAEAFNPRTLFLIGNYTIGKERLFLGVARVLRRKVYVTASKLRLLECLELSKEDMQWLTSNEKESHIHVMPMWTLASFKRLKHISSQYAGRFSLIVAFTPTGWTFGKGKKKNTPGRRWQQGTIIRYEVPYSEHCSFTELREFVQIVSPEKIIPSVNNNGPDSADAMVALLRS